jgi:hypothetical protein
MCLEIVGLEPRHAGGRIEAYAPISTERVSKRTTAWPAGAPLPR